MNPHFNQKIINIMMKAALLFLLLLPLLHAFVVPSCQSRSIKVLSNERRNKSNPLNMIDQKRRKQLGIPDDEDEYDLYKALDVNTDKGITKIVAGSFIVVVIALLVFGLV